MEEEVEKTPEPVVRPKRRALSVMKESDANTPRKVEPKTSSKVLLTLAFPCGLPFPGSRY
jgi:hypothetical protein